MDRRKTFRNIDGNEIILRMLEDYTLSGIMRKRFNLADADKVVMDYIEKEIPFEKYVVIDMHLECEETDNIFEKIPFYEFDEMLERNLPVGFKYIFFEVNSDPIYIVDISEAGIDEETFKLKMREAMQLIAGSYKREYAIDATVTCSEILEGIENIVKAYDQAQEMHVYISVSGYKDVHFYDELKKYHLTPILPVEEIDKKIVNYTRIGDCKKLHEFLTMIFDDWEKSGISIYAAQGIASSIFCKMSTALENYYNFNSVEEFQEELTSIVREKSIDGIEKKLYEYARKYCKQVQEMSKNYQINGLVEKIEKILDENVYDERMNISFLAEKVGLNSKYMAATYEEKTGISLLENINRKRIEHFKELIRSGMEIKDAASACGYCSLVTLNRWFKKSEGTTPGKIKGSFEYIRKAPKEDDNDH